jgi:DNA-binding transcriptional MocR family regulator
MSPAQTRIDALPQPATAATPLARGARLTLAEQLAQRFEQRITQRVLAAGARLPSVRECARLQGVSPATVVGAYDLLQAQGLVEARPHKGFFVRGLRHPAPRSAAALEARAQAQTQLRDAPVDATALIRGMFRPTSSLPSPGIGTLPEAWLDAALLQRALRRVSSAGTAAGWLGYGHPSGDPSLRDALTRRLASLDITAHAQQIVTTVGATQALDLVSRTLLQPGDAVLVDEPGWAVEFARLSRLGVRILPVPRGAQGPDLDVMEALCKAHAPRMYVTVSVLHNPTGASLSAASAHRVLQLAERHDFTIVEDDSYAWFAPAHAVRLSSLDGLRRTVLVSGFSKILTPQWRVGFLACAPALAERIVDTKLLTTLTSPAPLERAVAWCLDQGLLRRHAERIVAQLDAARVRAHRLAEDAGCRLASPPRGLFGWVDTGIDTDRLAMTMLDEGWLLAPGSLFHAVRQPSTLMRINFATAQDARFWRRYTAARASQANLALPLGLIPTGDGRLRPALARKAATKQN